jgi:hypothetical protein
MEGGGGLRFDSLQNRWFLGLSQGGEPGHILLAFLLLAFLAVDGGGRRKSCFRSDLPVSKTHTPFGF